MNPPATSVWLHRFAWVTAALTLMLPVTTGAIVTTLKAGMVFSDWPSSDGYNMLAYPWLTSARDQFVEHGHRLSGMTIALLSLLLAIAAWCLDRRNSFDRWPRRSSPRCSLRACWVAPAFCSTSKLWPCCMATLPRWCSA